MSGSPDAPLVVHVIYALGTGGLENGLLNILNRFPADAYRHAIICLTESGEFASRLEREDVEIYTLEKKEGHDPLMYWRLWKLLRRLGPSILHTRNMAALETQIISVFRPRLKTVHGEHGRDIHDLDGTNRKYIFLRRLLQPLVGSYIAVSQDLDGWLRDTVGIPAKKIHQIYNGVDTSKYNPSLQGPANADIPGWPDHWRANDAPIVGTVGRLAEVKDQASLLRALALLLSGQTELAVRPRMIIVGDGPLLADLQQLASSLGIQESVWFAGDRADTPALLAAMDVFVLPSLGEGISNTILEAMSSGLPIVASDVGGNPELVHDNGNGYLVDPGNIEQLAERISELLVDQQLRRALGAASRERIERDFCWDKTVREYRAVYDRLLNRDGALD